MVSGAPVPRRRTPVVCIAYGEPGLAWLRALRRRCVDNPNVAGLVERDVVQFWCVGAAASGVEGVRMFKEVPTFVVASEVLAGARTARVMAECPGLSVHSITVMERVSLFEEGIAELRQRVRDVLEAVPEYANLGSTGQSGFAYDWIALADSLHEPARVTPEMRAAA